MRYEKCNLALPYEPAKWRIVDKETNEVVCTCESEAYATMIEDCLNQATIE
jgi:hypothetical protein